MSTPPGPQEPVGGYGDSTPPPNYYGGAGTPPTPPPPNHLVWGIVGLLFCLPLGIPALIFSTQVNSKWAAGDVAGANDASSKAKKFGIWALVAGLVGTLLYIIFFVVLAAAGTMSTTTGS